jgi:hypothetical protein
LSFPVQQVLEVLDKTRPNSGQNQNVVLLKACPAHVVKVFANQTEIVSSQTPLVEPGQNLAEKFQS